MLAVQKEELEEELAEYEPEQTASERVEAAAMRPTAISVLAPQRYRQSQQLLSLRGPQPLGRSTRRLTRLRQH